MKRKTALIFGWARFSCKRCLWCTHALDCTLVLIIQLRYRCISFLLGFFHSSAAQSWDNISWNGMRSGIWYTANNKTIMDNSGSNTRNFLFSTRKLCYRPLYTWSSTCTRIFTLFETTKIWSITLQIPKKHKYTIEIDDFSYYYFFLLAAALFRNHTARKSHINTKTTHFDKRLKKKNQHEPTSATVSGK